MIGWTSSLLSENPLQIWKGMLIDLFPIQNTPPKGSPNGMVSCSYDMLWENFELRMNSLAFHIVTNSSCKKITIG
jgi:hypothetical protein